MSDGSVRAALRSDAPLVVVEAPAGCGKTHQGADYAREAIVGATDVEGWGGRVVRVPLVQDQSTTNLLQRLRRG